MLYSWSPGDKAPFFTDIYPTSQFNKYPISTGLAKQQILISGQYPRDKIAQPSKEIQGKSLKAHVKSSNFRALKKLNIQMPEREWIAKQHLGMIWKTAWIIPWVSQEQGHSCKARVCIYRNTAHKVWETYSPLQGARQQPGHCPHCSSYTILSPARTPTGHLESCSTQKKNPKPTNNKQPPNKNKTIHRVSLDQKAKGGRGRPGSNGCHYGHFLTWNYQLNEEQFCNEKSCFEESSDQLLPILLGAMQWQSGISIRI